MNDALYALIFLMIFALCCLLYGGRIYITGDKNLLPYKAQHSIANEDDVRNVGFWTMAVAMAGAALCAIILLFWYIFGFMPA